MPMRENKFPNVAVISQVPTPDNRYRGQKQEMANYYNDVHLKSVNNSKYLGRFLANANNCLVLFAQ